MQNSDYPALEKLTDLAVKEKQKFERIMVSKEKLLEMFGVRVSPSVVQVQRAHGPGSITSTKST